MGLRLRRFPEYGVALHIRSGAFNGEELLRYFRSLGPADALRWIYYYDETADASGVMLGHIPELKHTINAKLEELFGDRPPASIVVNRGAANQSYVDFWAGFTTRDQYPAAPLQFSTLKAACEELGLSDAACEALEDAVSAETERPRAEGLQARRGGPAMPARG